jgi:hypothetical protein
VRAKSWSPWCITLQGKKKKKKKERASAEWQVTCIQAYSWWLVTMRNVVHTHTGWNAVGTLYLTWGDVINGFLLRLKLGVFRDSLGAHRGSDFEIWITETGVRKLCLHRIIWASPCTIMIPVRCDPRADPTAKGIFSNITSRQDAGSISDEVIEFFSLYLILPTWCSLSL